MYHTTEGAQINHLIPANLRGMNAMQISDAVFKAEIARPAGSETHTAGYTMLEATASAIFDPADWKAPINAILPQDAAGADALEWAAAAVIFYHGAEPRRSFVGVFSYGYAC